MLKKILFIGSIAMGCVLTTSCDDNGVSASESSSSSTESVSSSSTGIPYSSATAISSSATLSSSSVTVSSSSSQEQLSSSSESTGSSSSVTASSSSSQEPLSSSSESTGSSSSVTASSSSSQEPLSSSSSFTYTDWNSCVSAGMCGTFADTRETPSRFYKWVKIGSQSWMAENLAYLPSVNKGDDHSNLLKRYYVYNYNGESVSAAKEHSNNDNTFFYYEAYGALYNWKAAQEACPEGWHLPTQAEWDTLVTAVGGSQIAGKKLKALTSWSWAGHVGEDAYGFSAVVAGINHHYSGYISANGSTSWWTATTFTATTPNDPQAWYRVVDQSGDGILEGGHAVKNGLSIRCVKDN